MRAAFGDLGMGASPNPTTTSAKSGASPAMLLVDDDVDVLQSMRTLIERMLPTVRLFTAPSGPEGLKTLRRERVQLIVTDYKMPGMNGIEFLKEAAKVAPGVTRLMITAYPDPSVAAQAVREAGAALLITKPFDPNYFVEVLGSILLKSGTAPPRA